MRKFLIALALVLVPLTAMGLGVTKSSTFQGVTIAVGDTVQPVNGIKPPNRAEGATVILDRTNWPAEGVWIAIEVTFDNGNNWSYCAGPTWIAQGTVNPKTGTIPKASIGCGWNPDRFSAPDAGRLRTNNLGAAFTTDIELDWLGN
jgi:hypothetical protein